MFLKEIEKVCREEAGAPRRAYLLLWIKGRQRVAGRHAARLGAAPIGAASRLGVTVEAQATKHGGVGGTR